MDRKDGLQVIVTKQSVDENAIFLIHISGLIYKFIPKEISDF